MWSPKRLRDELRFVSEFSALLDVMQHVAVSKLRWLDERVSHEPALAGLLAQSFFPLLPEAAHREPLVRGGARGRLLVVLTSDEGMVGPLHNRVVHRALEQSDETTQWLLIGQRALRLLGGQVRAVRTVPLPSIEDVPAFTRQLCQTIIGDYTRARLQGAWLVAARYQSPTRQDVLVQPLLPLPLAASTPEGSPRDRVIEPSVHRVVIGLASCWVEAVCVEAFYSARRAELAARALHIEFSRQELGKQTRRLRYEWFKSLHQRVDEMVRETCRHVRH